MPRMSECGEVRLSSRTGRGAGKQGMLAREAEGRQGVRVRGGGAFRPHRARSSIAHHHATLQPVGAYGALLSPLKSGCRLTLWRGRLAWPRGGIKAYPHPILLMRQPHTRTLYL